MSDDNVQDQDWFDADNFAVTSKLGGKRGTIVDAEVILHDYNGSLKTEVTALRVKVVSPELEKPAVNFYGTGDALKPSASHGGAPETSGAFLTGQPARSKTEIGKNTNVSLFMQGVKESGFPLDEFRKEGFAALTGADFTWRSVEKKVGGKGETKVYDIPAEFHGKVDVTTVVAKDVSEDGAAPKAEAPATAVDVKQVVSDAIKQALANSPEKELPRGQLSKAISPAIKEQLPPAQQTKALALLINDNFLSNIEGTSFDKKTIKLVE